MCDSCACSTTTPTSEAASATGRISYSVTGMTCGHCENAVIEEVGKISGIGDVQADATAGTVSFTGTDVDEAALRAAVDEAGYQLAGRR
jgi:copper chaperone CopZ